MKSRYGNINARDITPRVQGELVSTISALYEQYSHVSTFNDSKQESDAEILDEYDLATSFLDSMKEDLQHLTAENFFELEDFLWGDPDSDVFISALYNLSSLTGLIMLGGRRFVGLSLPEDKSIATASAPNAFVGLNARGVVANFAEHTYLGKNAENAVIIDFSKSQSYLGDNAKNSLLIDYFGNGNIGHESENCTTISIRNNVSTNLQGGIHVYVDRQIIGFSMPRNYLGLTPCADNEELHAHHFTEQGNDGYWSLHHNSEFTQFDDVRFKKRVPSLDAYAEKAAHAFDFIERTYKDAPDILDIDWRAYHTELKALNAQVLEDLT